MYNTDNVTLNMNDVFYRGADSKEIDGDDFVSVYTESEDVNHASRLILLKDIAIRFETESGLKTKAEQADPELCPYLHITY